MCILCVIIVKHLKHLMMVTFSFLHILLNNDGFIGQIIENIVKVIVKSYALLLQRVGYLAASQCFHDGTDVLMLTTNMIRKVLKF